MGSQFLMIALPEFAHAPEPWRVMRSAGLSGSDLPMIRQEIGLRAPGRTCRADPHLTATPDPRNDYIIAAGAGVSKAL